MITTLEERFAASARRCTARGIRTSKLQLAFDALNFADGRVAEAKDIIAKRGVRISARTHLEQSNRSTSRVLTCSISQVTEAP